MKHRVSNQYWTSVLPVSNYDNATITKNPKQLNAGFITWGQFLILIIIRRTFLIPCCKLGFISCDHVVTNFQFSRHSLQKLIYDSLAITIQTIRPIWLPWPKRFPTSGPGYTIRYQTVKQEYEMHISYSHSPNNVHAQPRTKRVINFHHKLFKTRC